MKNTPLKVCNTAIEPGERVTLGLPTPEMYTCAKMHVPIHVIHGKNQGPCLVICGAMHGDEINSVAISERFLRGNFFKGLCGTVIVIPVLNVFGLLTQSSNYLDQSDLEQSFPGTENGSFAERQAYLLTEHILSKATHCIDLHTGRMQLYRFPQVYTDFEHEAGLEMAKAFRAPILRDTKESRGLLWMMHRKGENISSIPSMIYEVGESFRMDDREIQNGVKGIVSVMKHLGMIKRSRFRLRSKKELDSMPVEATAGVWSPGSGLVEFAKTCGMHVKKNELVAFIVDPFGTKQRFKVVSPCDGVVIGENRKPMVAEGDFLFEIAKISDRSSIMPHLEQWEQGSS